MADLLDYADERADALGVPRGLARALIGQESGGDPNAVSYKGARGVTQVMPGTMRGLGYDPATATSNDYVDAGLSYLRQNYERFGSWDKAVAAYHAGPGAVERAGGIPNTSDGLSTTRDYTRNVLARSGLSDGGDQTRGTSRLSYARSLMSFLDSIPTSEPSSAPRMRTWGEAASDAGRATMSGLAGLVKSGGDLYGLAAGDMNNPMSELGKNAQEYWTEGQSQPLKDKIAARRAAIDAADGTLAKFGTAVKETVTDPALMADLAFGNAATMIPAAAAGRGVQALMGARALAAGGLTEAAAAAAARTGAKVATGAAVGTGAVQQGADVASNAYDDAIQKTAAELSQNPEFVARVQAGEAPKAVAMDLGLSAARAAFLPATAISVAANAIPGGTMLERALIGGAARNTIKAGTKYALPKAMLKAGLGEGGQETVEEGGGQLAANLAERAYVDPNQSLSKGVGENAGLGFAGGLGLGVPGGALHRQQGALHVEPAPLKTAGDLIREDLQPGSGPLVNAVNAGVETAARNADANMPPEVQAAIVQTPRLANAEMVAAIRSLPAEQQEEALHLHNLGNNMQVAGGVRRYAQNRLDELLGPVQPEETSVQPNTAEAAPAAPLTPDRSGDAAAPLIEQQLDAKSMRLEAQAREQEARSAYEQRRADRPPQPVGQPAAGDILATHGGPFKTIHAAMRAQSAYPGSEMVRVDGGIVIRRPRDEAAAGEPEKLAASGSTPTTTEVNVASHEAATSPPNDRTASEAQLEGGNAKLGHINLQGLDISIEHPKGSTRTKLNPDGTEKFSRVMGAHYGYLERSEGADGDHLDVYVGPRPDAPQAFVIDQLKADGSFDETKTMLGYATQMAAVRAYRAHFPKGFKVGPVTTMPIEQFKAWAQSEAAKGPAAATTPATAAKDAARARPARLKAETAQVVSVETYLVRNGAARQDIGDAGTHRRGERHTDKTWRRVVEQRAKKDAALLARREELRAKYEGLVAEGRIRPPTALEETERTAAGQSENKSVQAARRLLEKKGKARAGTLTLSAQTASEPSSPEATTPDLPIIGPIDNDSAIHERVAGDDGVHVEISSADAGRFHATLFDSESGKLIATRIAGNIERARFEADRMLGRIPQGTKFEAAEYRQPRTAASIDRSSVAATRSTEEPGREAAVEPTDSSPELMAKEREEAYRVEAQRTGIPEQILKDQQQFEMFDGVDGPTSSEEDSTDGNGDALPGRERGVVAQAAAADGLRRIRDAVQRRASITALGIPERIERTGSTALLGARVAGVNDLAALAQVYRDPRYETFRVFLVKGGVVVHATGISSRMPGFTPIVPAGTSVEQYLDDLRDVMARTGADGYYLLHNHPSGNPAPSPEDERLTRFIERRVPGFKGHVVINSGKYAFIGAGGAIGTRTLEIGEDTLLKASKPSAFLNREIRGPADLVAIGKSLQRPGWLTLIGRGAQAEVRALAEAPSSVLTRNYPYLAATVRRLMRNSGSTEVFLVGSDADVASAPVKAGLRAGILRDVVGETGNSTAAQQGAEIGRSIFAERPGRAVMLERGPVAKSIVDATNKVADKLNPGPIMAGRTNRDYTPAQLRSMQNVGFEVEPPTIQERAQALWKDAGKKLAQGLVDQFAPVKDIDATAYGLLRLSKGASGAFETLLRGGQLRLRDGVYDFDETKGGGVVDQLLIPLQGEHHDFLRWVAANRAERLKGAGKENLFSDADIAALKSLSDGKVSFDYTVQNGPRAGTVTRDRTLIYADSLKTFNDFNRNVLDMAEQSGLIDGEARKLWENEFYVPFYRVEDDGTIGGPDIKNGAVRQQAFKSLIGRTNKLNADLLDNTLMNWAHLLDAAAKNRAAKASIEAAERMGAASPIEGQAGKGTVWFREAGARRYSMVSDPYLLTAISALEYTGMRSPMMKAMGAFKHALTVGVTASPFFKVRNLIRDSVQVIGTSGISPNALGNVVQGWKATDPKSDAYFRLLAGGGTIHFGAMLEGSEAKRVQALVEAGVDESTILNSDQKLKAFYRKVIQPGIQAYNALGDRGEAINRAALYEQLVKQGMNHAEATLQARDLMDFSMQGSFATIRFLTQVVPFFNARLQGLYKLGRSAKEGPVRFSAVIGAAALLSIGLLAAGSDDDDWKKREEWDRNNFWWFKFGGVAFRIPKPFEIGAIATLAERGFELAFDKEMTGKRFRAQVLSLLGDNLSMNPIPQLVKPMLDVYANKDSFTGRPIETMGMEKLKPEYRVTDRTTMAARALSTTANAVTGLVGADAPSPVQVDHLLRGYFGWLGTFVVGAGDVIARLVSDQPAQPTPDYWKTATGGMVSDLRDAPSRYVSQMYTQARELEQAYGTWQALRKEGKTEAAAAFGTEHKEDLAQYRKVERVKETESRINARIRAIRGSERPGDEKRSLIRDLQVQKDRVARSLVP